jgi:hypothetical protein
MMRSNRNSGENKSTSGYFGYAVLSCFLEETRMWIRILSVLGAGMLRVIHT